MATPSKILDVGRELLARQPNITDEELRTYLKREFLIDRDVEVALLRARAWCFVPLAQLVKRILYGARQSQEVEIVKEVELAIRELRRTILLPVNNVTRGLQDLG
jgi:hypothetical protein